MSIFIQNRPIRFRFLLIVMLPMLCVIFSSVTEAQLYPGNISSYTIEGKAVTVHAESAAVRFVFYSPDILRVDFLPSPSSVVDSSFVVVQDTGTAVGGSIFETDSTVEIFSTAMRAVCTRTPLRISYYDAGGKLLLSEPASGGLGATPSSRIANFTLTASDHYYGTGERGTALDRRGQAFDSYNTQTGGYTSPLSTMNINVPFVASTNGYAIYFDNSYPGRFDFGNSNPSKFSYTANGGELSCYVIAAGTIAQQLERYTWLTGRQPMPPRWALGFIQSKYGYHNETEAAAMITTMRQKGIPCDAIVLDMYWYSNMGDLSWNTASWPQPLTMMSDFLSQGFKTIVITEPYIVQPSINFSDADAAGYFAQTASHQSYLLSNWWSCGCTAGLLDITNPAARQWWWSKHPAFFGNELAGIWTDLGEPENHPNDMVHYLGPTAKVHNIYNLLWAKTVFEGFGQMEPNRRLLNLTRSGYAGIQRYGVVPWSGDVGKGFGGLAVQQAMMLGMGMSGLAYHNSDIGGFCCGSTTAELYIRWMQYGVFCPVTRAHGTGQPTEPWGYGAQAESICTKFLRLRYQLLPYNYTLAHENYTTGMPLARPLLFDNTAPASLLNESGSYMWGPSLLVSPVVAAGQTSKNVYLPPGSWFDYWTDQATEGGKTVTAPSPLDRLPLFVKAGAIIPMQAVMNYSDEHPLDTLFLEIYPAANRQGTFTLYEDDGNTLDYQSGRFALTALTQQMSQTADSSANTQILDVLIGNSQGSFNGMPTRRVYIAGIHAVSQKPAGVTVNDQPFGEQLSYSALRSNGSGYYFDATAERLFILIPGSVDSSYHITVQNIQTTTSVGQSPDPLQFHIYQNFPNPFNPTTNIRYSLPHADRVTLKLFNLLGQEVKTLVDESESPGLKTVSFDAGTLPSGVYFYRLQTSSYVETKKLVLVR